MLPRVPAMVILTAMCFPLPAFANELYGDRSISITHETLTIDLRPLAEAKPAVVDVMYDLDNAGADRTLDLGFFRNDVSHFEMWLDEKRILQDQAPAKSDKRFFLDLPSGRHKLKVHYQAKVRKTIEEDRATVLWRFSYSFEPARQWGNFGTLDIVLHVPPNWVAGYGLLTRSKDTLTGSFAGIPQNDINIPVRAREGWMYFTVLYGARVLLAIICVAGLVVSWRIGRGMGDRDLVKSMFRSSAVGVIWAVAICLAGYASIEGPHLESLLPSEQTYEYVGDGKVYAWLGVFLLAILALLIGMGTTFFSAAAPHPGQPDPLGKSSTGEDSPANSASEVTP